MTYQEARTQITEKLNNAGITISMGPQTREELLGVLGDLVNDLMTIKKRIKQEGIES